MTNMIFLISTLILFNYSSEGVSFNPINSINNAIQTAENNSKSLTSDVIQSLPAIPGLSELQTICYENVGCFSNHDNFNLFNNPISLLPMSPDQIDVAFNLFTCDNRYKPIVFKYNSGEHAIRVSTFNGTKRTKFITHGFGGSYDDMGWTGDMKDRILETSCEYNVIGVDWSEGAKGPNYPQALANTRVVGAVLANFIKQLIDVSLSSADKFDLIGHSLGAHTSGFAGARIQNPKINKIVGLDPAGPGFQTNNTKYRLDQTDASLVVNLHTDGGEFIGQGFGIMDALGHYDIYPNGGTKQPGCEKTQGVSNVLLNGVEGLSETITCNHGRAQELAIANTAAFGWCQLIAYQCMSYSDFLHGKCADCGADGEMCKHIPLILDFWDNYDNHRVSQTQPEKSFYIQTTHMTPFCLFHYQIVIYTSKSSASTSGKIAITLYGEKRDVSSVELCKVFTHFKSGERYTYLLTYPKDLGFVANAQTFWTFGGIDQLNPINLIDKPEIIIESIEVNYMSNIDAKYRNQLSSKLCKYTANRFGLCGSQ